MFNFLTSHLKVALMHLRQPLGQGVVRGMKMVSTIYHVGALWPPSSTYSSFYTVPFLLDHGLNWVTAKMSVNF